MVVEVTMPKSLQTGARHPEIPAPAPDLAQAIEALAIALVLPAIVAGIATLNPFTMVVIAGVSLIHAVLLGLPAFLLLRRCGWVNILTSTFSGALIGGVPAAMAFADIPGQFLPFAGFGAASGLTFGLCLHLRHRVERA
jgi:hypothetical protein